MAIGAEPARDGAHTLADGRRLAYAEWGDLDGRPVVLHHGNPGSRLICPDVEATAAAGVRLLTVDRAGYGGSDPSTDASLGAAAADVAELQTALGIDACPVLGWSAGGAYALAAGALYPDRTTSVGVLCTLAPPDELPGERDAWPDAQRALVDRVRTGDPTAIDEVHARWQPWVDAPTLIVDRTLQHDTDPDRHLMALPEVAAALSAYWIEGARQGVAGASAGWMGTWALPWGFALAEVAVPVTIWHGTGDVILPVRHATFLAEAIPGAELRLFEGEGHLAPVDHFAEMLSVHAAAGRPG
jgi:pimeloyl-ACP methyl ester carboxylesterase